jgi:CRP-like cAMP-binding protein
MATRISPPAQETVDTDEACPRLPGAWEELAKISRCERGDIVYHQDDSADYWYQLIVGAARNSSVLADGRRHIVSFLFPGELFGFSSCASHRFSVEIISSHAVIARYSRRIAEKLAESNPEVSRLVRQAAVESITRLQSRMVVLLGRSGAVEKVAAFLIEMKERAAGNGIVELPMSRYDIADYLSISVETVSRSLTALRSKGLIALIGKRRIKIVDTAALTAVAGVVQHISR